MYNIDAIIAYRKIEIHKEVYVPKGEVLTSIGTLHYPEYRGTKGDLYFTYKQELSNLSEFQFNTVYYEIIQHVEIIK